MSVALVAVLVASASTEAMCAAWCAVERSCVQRVESASSGSHEHHHATEAAAAGTTDHHHGVVPPAEAGLRTAAPGDAAFVSSACCQPANGVPIASFVASRSDDVVSIQDALYPAFLAAVSHEQRRGYLRTRDTVAPGTSRSIQLSSVLRI